MYLIWAPRVLRFKGSRLEFVFPRQLFLRLATISVPYNNAVKKINNTKTENGESDSLLVLLKGKYDEETAYFCVVTLFDVPTNGYYYTMTTKIEPLPTRLAVDGFSKHHCPPNENCR
jgi:hypothetical protein